MLNFEKYDEGVWQEKDLGIFICWDCGITGQDGISYIVIPESALKRYRWFDLTEEDILARFKSLSMAVADIEANKAKFCQRHSTNLLNPQEDALPQQKMLRGIQPMKKFVVRYWEKHYIERVIEAEDEADACVRMNRKLCFGEIDTAYAETEDSGCDTREATAQDLQEIALA